MDFFTKQRIWLLLAIFLLITNVATITTLAWHNKRRGHHSGQHEAKGRHNDFFAEKLNLSAAQQKSFRAIDSLYDVKREELSKQVDQQKDVFFRYLHADQLNEKTLDSLANEIGILSSGYNKLKVEKILKLREICSEDQRKKLSALLLDIDSRKGKGMNH